MPEQGPRIAVLGAGGLIGHAVALDLQRRGFPVLPVARRFTAAQTAALGSSAVERSVADLDPVALRALLKDSDVVVNCLGILQDGPSSSTDDVHCGFVGRLLQAVTGREDVVLIHVSMPGREEDDETMFSRTKRSAERLIRRVLTPHVILRPGFVIAPAAYGGSAMVRALATLPFALPIELARRPFASVEVGEIAATIAVVAARWRAGERGWHATWDVMERQPMNLGEAVEAFRRHLGGSPPLLRLPLVLLSLGSRAGDLASYLGWAPPNRSTALAELRRGVEGDPRPWIEATGIAPSSLASTLARLPATVQERWFARLYLLKPAIIACLALFWIVSGLIALAPSFEAAAAILTTRGFPPALAGAITWISSLVDIGVGLLIAFRRTCRAGLVAGIAASIGYMTGAAALTPDLWLEPLGALVKTGPAIVLMLVALAILDSR